MNGAPYREGPTGEELARLKAQRAEREREALQAAIIVRFAEAARACGVTPVSLARALVNLFKDPKR